VAAPRAGEAVGAVREDFEPFYVREYPRVAAYCFQLVRDRDAAADLTQEAFARLLARWVSVRSPRAYLFHVVTNLARAQWRSTARARQILPLLLADEATAATDTGLRDAVQRLPHRYREIVLLHYYADFPLTEIAHIIRRPEGTARRLLSEARTRLATALEDPRA
jgi:RNA polymerase sigma-70 factor (ECF subfamily)